MNSSFITSRPGRFCLLGGLCGLLCYSVAFFVCLRCFNRMCILGVFQWTSGYGYFKGLGGILCFSVIIYKF